MRLMFCRKRFEKCCFKINKTKDFGRRIFILNIFVRKLSFKVVLVVISVTFWASGLGAGRYPQSHPHFSENTDFIYIIPITIAFLGLKQKQGLPAHIGCKLCKGKSSLFTYILTVGLCLPHPDPGSEFPLCHMNTEAITYPLGRHCGRGRSILSLSGEE